MFAPFPSGSLPLEERENMNLGIPYRSRKNKRPFGESSSDLGHGCMVPQGTFDDQFFGNQRLDDNAQSSHEDDGDWEEWPEEYYDMIASLESVPSLDFQRRYPSVLQPGQKNDALNLNGDNYSDGDLNYSASQGDADPSYSDLLKGTDYDGASSTTPEVPFDAYLSFPPEEFSPGPFSNSVSTLENRFVNLSLINPFEIHRDGRYKTARETFPKPEGGYINGYIKFHMGSASAGNLEDPDPKRRCSNNRTALTEAKYRERLKKFGYSLLPRNFSTGLRLDSPDLLCWTFYRSAYCQGRTLLSGTNFWFTDILPMAEKDLCVRHALLALSGSYILDYKSDDKLRERVNKNYTEATKMITNALTNPTTHAVGNGDNIVAAIILLIVDDCVNWELRTSKGTKPNWYQAAQLATSLLDHSDPGYRYWKPDNVQCTTARLGYANWAALACILAQPVTPLDLNIKANAFGWLLQGSREETYRIHGGTGLSPKLLHIFSQVTYLSGLITRGPSIVPERTGLSIQRMLEDFRQSSEASDGYSSPEALLKSCDLREDGKVYTVTKVTELTGQTWVSAAQIYLHCRLFRKPRMHPDVQRSVNILLKCVTLMPYTGILFTSQAPFFPIFLVSLVCVKEKERRIAREWFETIVSGASCRSSVPPVWEAVKAAWEWFDDTGIDNSFNEKQPIRERVNWWEQMVDHLIETVGYISLT